MEFRELKEDLIEYAIKDELKNNEFEYISSGLNKTYLLMDGDVIIGAVNYSIAYDSSDILFIYINEEYRKKGYSEVLLSSSLSELKKLGIKEVYLEVKETNNAAYHLYKKTGFIEVGKRKKYYSDNTDAILMKKIVG